MGQQLIIPSVFQAIDRMSPAMALMTRNVGKLGTSAEIALARGERSFRRLMNPLNSLGNKFNNVMGGLGAPIGIAALGLAAKKTADVFIDFGQANSNVAAAMDMTLAQITPLTTSAKRLGAVTKFTASEVSGLQFELAKLGFSQDQILKMTESTLSLAAATQFELGPAATTVGSALRAYGLQADQTARVTDVLAASASKTALDMNDFFENLSTFAPVARAFNFSMEDSIALFGRIRDAGFDASSAATALRNIFLNLADSNGKLARALGKPAQNLDELLGGMIKLRNAGVNLATMLEITDKRSVAAFSTLLNGAESVKTLANELHRADGFAKKMANTQLDNVQGSLTILKSAWEGWVLSVDDGTNSISHGIRTVSSVFTDMLQVMSGTAKATAELNETERHIRSNAEAVMFLGKTALYVGGALLYWKGVMIAGRLALTAMNVAIGIGNALFTTSTVLTYENVVAQKAYLMTSKAVSIALEVLHGNLAALNGTMLASAPFLLAAGITAVVGAVYYMNKANEEAIENYQHILNLRVGEEYSRQKKYVDDLAKSYQNLGYNIKDSMIKSVEMQYMMANRSLVSAQQKVESARQNLINAYDNSWFPAFSSNVSSSQGEYDAARQELTRAQTGRGAITDQISDMFRQGMLNATQANNIFKGNPLNISMQQQTPARQFQQPMPALNQSLINEMNQNIGNMKVSLEIKNNSDLPVALNNGGAVLNVQPKTNSTTVMDRK